MKIPGRPDESSPVSLLRCCLHPPSMVDSQRRQVLLQVVRPPLLRPAHGAPPLWHIKHDVPGCPGCGHAGDVASPAEPEGPQDVADGRNSCQCHQVLVVSPAPLARLLVPNGTEDSAQDGPLEHSDLTSHLLRHPPVLTAKKQKWSDNGSVDLDLCSSAQASGFKDPVEGPRAATCGSNSKLQLCDVTVLPRYLNSVTFSKRSPSTTRISSSSSRSRVALIHFVFSSFISSPVL